MVIRNLIEDANQGKNLSRKDAKTQRFYQLPVYTDVGPPVFSKRTGRRQLMSDWLGPLSFDFIVLLL